MLKTKHYKLKTRKVYPERSRGGFTLVELMVTIAILGIVVVMIGNLTNFTVGRLKSNQLKQTNDAIRSALNLIGQKMNNANAHKESVYGFKVTGTDPDKVLMIASSGSNDTDITCTYFGLNSTNNQIMMDQDTVCTPRAASTLVYKVTPDNIYVSTFTPDASNPMTGTGQTQIPKVTITVEAYDKTAPAITATRLETTFVMDGENVKYLNN